MINGRTSKSVESDSKLDDKELVTAIESVLWRNDKNQKSQSIKKPSIPSSNEIKADNNPKRDENKTFVLNSQSNDSKETLPSSSRYL